MRSGGRSLLSTPFRRKGAPFTNVCAWGAMGLLSLGLALLFCPRLAGGQEAAKPGEEPTFFAAETPPVAVGVWAAAGEQDAARRWGPTLKYIGEKIPGRSFVLVPLAYNDLVDQVKLNTLDFVIVDAALYALLETRYGIEIMATAQSRFKDTDFALAGGTLFRLSGATGPARPSDLKGRKIASVNEQSLDDWLSVRREYRAIGIDPQAGFADVAFVGSEDEVVSAVLEGRADAGAVKAGALERIAAERKLDPARFSVLAFDNITPPNPYIRIPELVSTRLYPDWAFAACSKAAPKLVKDVGTALLNMAGRYPEIVDRPNLIGWASPRSDVRVHELLRELRLAPYEHFGEVTFAEVVRQHMYWFLGGAAAMILMLLVTLYVLGLNHALRIEIAERKRAEAALRESVERFENIAACSADWIWETDNQGLYSYSSSIVRPMLGYSPEEVVGKSPLELLATAERERLAAAGQTTLGRGSRLFRQRYRLLTKDGRVVIHECTAEPVLNSQGELIGYRGVNRDITNQVRFVRLRE